MTRTVDMQKTTLSVEFLQYAERTDIDFAVVKKFMVTTSHVDLDEVLINDPSGTEVHVSPESPNLSSADWATTEW